MNAKDEMIDHITSKVECAFIEYIPDDGSDIKNKKICILRIDHDAEEFQDWLDELDFEYHDGFGGQELFGIVWYVDGSWSERKEYDGSEEWAHKVRPKVDFVLMQETLEKKNKWQYYTDKGETK
jgi:hypothetical protein